MKLIVFRFYYIRSKDVGITFLRAPTHYGKLNWDRLFPSIIEKGLKETDVIVVSSILFLSSRLR